MNTTQQTADLLVKEYQSGLTGIDYYVPFSEEEVIRKRIATSEEVKNLCMELGVDFIDGLWYCADLAHQERGQVIMSKAYYRQYEVGFQKYFLKLKIT